MKNVQVPGSPKPQHMVGARACSRSQTHLARGRTLLNRRQRDSDTGGIALAAPGLGLGDDALH
jgi:hypothetical protein